ncbi:isocitrate lyase/phosphoenolpyruvate mutase family protein [Jatrophihabitans cynanchi]|jgi:2-methylisocitrate lyase-like PEP mutase family enzyme|uniref:Isocitrate lyase/phosphoenolpyruvate mutase family protein n=1 Tax=Jatrophihabitans cynanchi TaxID=2944128 RepID=A0ABY7K0D2_9ACTN|nr:isocitrate lyase/phosphoenolpyruvate mutase family protein [Jatrophihabitans sp. SB3-54]WAX57963.1 isocitrate lyase/phosphoenolpyruvate mutase family protein [Jatrophihabitans sp. SB3-54]
MSERADAFRALHVPGTPLLMPNPWDVGSALLLQSLGFAALATTSGGFAMTLGRPDGSVTREEALEHARELVAAVDVPVSADLENCFADDPAGVAATVAAAVETGLAGCSVEDWSGDRLYPLDESADRVRAAVEAARGHLVLTARAENHLRGQDDLADTISRLQAYQQAGADVLYAPGITDLGQIRSLVAELDRPVNVLAMSGGPSVAELAAAGVARVSVGSAFAFTAMGAVVEAARELQQQGTYGYTERARTGSTVLRAAFAPS